VVAASFALGERLDFLFLRRGLARFYNCARGYPATLDEFKAMWGDHGAREGFVVELSAAKCGPRRLFEDEEAQVYVAETLVDDEVRETEIMLANNREDGQLDFVVYQPDGRRTDRSTFPTVGGSEITAAAPYVCLTCHVDPQTNPAAWTYDVLLPEAGVCR
jgi:hypothetical protein